MSVERVELRDSVEMQSLVVLDTLKEITTITVDRNDKGDTLRLTQITDRTRASARDRFKDIEVKEVVRTDTVYVERRDSVRVDSSGLMVQGSSRASPFVRAVKWVVAVMVVICILIKGWTRR